MTTLFTLPTHLRDTIVALVDTDVALPLPLRQDLRATLEAAAAPPTATEDSIDDGIGDQVQSPTINANILDALSRWSGTDSACQELRRAGLNPADYCHIALLAGTEVYLTPKQRALAVSAENPDAPNPFLPAYFSPQGPSLGSEYRATARQLSTVLNILFSIFGAAGAVYVASVTGAGYSRETATLLAVATGVVVGIADAILVIIFQKRLRQDRADAAKRSIELNKGSAGGIPVQVEEPPLGIELEDEGEDEGIVRNVSEKRTLRLRRRGLGDEE